MTWPEPDDGRPETLLPGQLSRRSKEYGSLRAKVRRRDREVCRYCGIDCKKLRKKMRSLPKEVRQAKFGEFIARWKSRRRLCDVDHIIPRWAGGQDTMENMQVLCCRCHEAKTKVEMAEYLRFKKTGKIDPAAFASPAKTRKKPRPVKSMPSRVRKG